MKRLRLAKKIFFLSIMIFMGSIIVGLSFSDLRAVAASRYEKLQIFSKVLNLVQQYYVVEVDTEKLIYGGIKGMLSELDPHTNFLKPEIYKEFQSETSGEFGGLGIEVTIKKGILTIISPIEDSPAWKAGLKAGDKIVGINGESTKGFSLAEATQRMKGKRGSKVKLNIYRKGFEAPQEFAVTRGIVKLKSVKYVDLEKGYAYLRITSFIENTTRDFKKLLKKHKKKHGNIKGLLIDLRRNPGGLLDQAVKLSDLFLEKGLIVSTINRNSKEKEEYFAKASGTLEDFPVIILIDEYSASASEILSGALQDNKRALIMGQKSFGKGSVQTVVKLGDGSALKLTVAKYLTPSGKSIQAEGITPDVAIENYNPELLAKARIKKSIRREKDIKGHLLGEKEKKKKTKNKSEAMQFWWADSSNKTKKMTAKNKLMSKDFQVVQAYNYLKTWKVLRKMKQ